MSLSTEGGLATPNITDLVHDARGRWGEGGGENGGWGYNLLRGGGIIEICWEKGVRPNVGRRFFIISIWRQRGEKKEGGERARFQISKD